MANVPFKGLCLWQVVCSVSVHSTESEYGILFFAVFSSKLFGILGQQDAESRAVTMAYAWGCGVWDGKAGSRKGKALLAAPVKWQCIHSQSSWEKVPDSSVNMVLMLPD